MHGGAYVLGPLITHLKLARLISVNNDINVYLPDYTVSSQGAYPKALHELVRVYETLINKQGYKPENIVFAGDSAGGHAVLTVLLNLRNNRKEMPAGAILFSPWTDMTASSESYNLNRKTEVVLTKKSLNNASNEYFGPSGIDFKDPRISPAFADFSGLPKILMYASNDEILRGDAELVFEAAKKAGTGIYFIDYSVTNGDLMHVWPAIYSKGKMGDKIHNDMSLFIDYVTQE